MTLVPKKISRSEGTRLIIEWDDGHRSKHHMYVLRKLCPCAACQKEREENDGKNLLPILKPGQNELKEIKPVGNYALQFFWGDGHQTGIYTYAYLRNLCECEQCEGKRIPGGAGDKTTI